MQMMSSDIQGKIQKAEKEGTGLKLEDLLENPEITKNGPSQEIRQQIQSMLNMVSRDQVPAKLEELKSKIGGNKQYQQWYIYSILTRRVAAIQPNLMPTFHELISKFSKDSTIVALTLISDIVKKCIMINEDQFLKVSSTKMMATSSPIRQYLMTLGQFTGGLTLAKNKPIMGKYLDLKVILYEGYLSDKLKYAVGFVSKCLKEAAGSDSFKFYNPYMLGLLQFLREIYDAVQTMPQLSDINMEIQSLFTALKTDINEIHASHFIKAHSGYQGFAYYLHELSYLTSRCSRGHKIMRMSSPDPSVSLSNMVQH